MLLPNGMGHLTYSTLVHPGDTWDEMWQSLCTYLPKVKKRLSPNGKFGVSLVLSFSRPARACARGTGKTPALWFLEG